MSEELKPCPFCGSSNLWMGSKNTNDSWMYILCGTCKAQGTNVLSTKDDAKIYWNTRPLEDALRKQLDFMTEECKRMETQRDIAVEAAKKAVEHWDYVDTLKWGREQVITISRLVKILIDALAEIERLSKTPINIESDEKL